MFMLLESFPQLPRSKLLNSSFIVSKIVHLKQRRASTQIQRVGKPTNKQTRSVVTQAVLGHLKWKRTQRTVRLY